MMAAYKMSPLCSRQEGREVYFTAKLDERKLSISFPDVLLEKACGQDASEAKRKVWVKEHRTQLLNALAAARPVPTEFSDVLIEEIS